MQALRALALSLCLVLAAASAATGGVLVFAERAEVHSARVTLADLVSPRSRLSQAEEAQLAEVTVARAPEVGKDKELPGSRLRSLAKTARLPQTLTVLFPQRVVLTRATQVVTAAQVGRAFMDHLNERLGTRAPDADIHSLAAGRDLVAPAGRLELAVRLFTSRLQGRVAGTIDVLVDGSRVASTRCTATVDLYQEALVAKRSLPRRHVIAPEEVEVVRINTATLGGPAAADAEDVVGMRLRTPVAAGQPILLGRLERAPLVRRGDVVTMICNSGSLQVTAKGEAQETGYKDGRIRLTNLASKREVYGTVVDSGTVVVQF